MRRGLRLAYEHCVQVQSSLSHLVYLNNYKKWHRRLKIKFSACTIPTLEMDGIRGPGGPESSHTRFMTTMPIPIAFELLISTVLQVAICWLDQ